MKCVVCDFTDCFLSTFHLYQMFYECCHFKTIVYTKSGGGGGNKVYYGGLQNRELKSMNSFYHLIVVISCSVRKTVN